MNPIISSATQGQSNSFLVPEGVYRGFLHRITQLAGEPRVRLLFRIPETNTPGNKYMAGRNFPVSLDPGSELRKALITWRGHDFTDQEKNAANFHLDAFIGMPADLVITHIPNLGYGNPYVYIEGIYKAGTKLPYQPVSTNVTINSNPTKSPALIFGSGDTQNGNGFNVAS